MTVSEQVTNLFAQVEARYGSLDILVNNVGDFLGLVKPLEHMTDHDIDGLFSVNLRQVMICSREAIPLLRKAPEGAAIVSISSIEGYRGMPNITPYGAYKLGIEGFTKSLALELAPDRIRVNAIAPGGALAAAGWYQTPEGHWTNTPIVDRSGIPSLRVD